MECIRREFVSRLGLILGRDLPRRCLGTAQKPQGAVLGCADSRVYPSLIFDQGLGDLFEVRTAGNVASAVVFGSLEYAVENIPLW